MSIQEIIGKFKAFLLDTEAFTAVLLILVALTSFGLGRMSVELQNKPYNDKSETRFTLTTSVIDAVETAPATTGETVATEGNYVASKNGTKYHLPWCPGAKQMNEENKVWFATKEEAESAGYLPAANCKGL